MVKRKIIFSALATWALHLLIACGSQPPQTATAPRNAAAVSDAQVSSARIIASEATLAVPTAEAVQVELPVIVYARYGGLTGRPETLTIQIDGQLRLQRGDGTSAQGQATQTQLGVLHTLLVSAEFAALAPEYPAHGADLVTHEIRLLYPSGERVVLAADGASLPPMLEQALATLATLRVELAQNELRKP